MAVEPNYRTILAIFDLQLAQYLPLAHLLNIECLSFNFLLLEGHHDDAFHGIFEDIFGRVIKGTMDVGNVLSTDIQVRGRVL